MNTQVNKTEENLFPALIYKYIPFWPLFLMLLVLAVAGAWAYLNYFSTPLYSTKATIIIKDEKKGMNDSRMTESFDAFTSNKIVENEIKVLQSNTLLNKVVVKLGLYAPIYIENDFRKVPAYTSSPVRVELKYPHQAEFKEHIPFKYNPKSLSVRLNKTDLKLDRWYTTPYGELRFVANPNFQQSSDKTLYFNILPPKYVASNLYSRISIEAENKMSSVINLQLRDTSPERGEAILNELIHAYKEVAIQERSKLAENTLNFVENRIRLVEEELNNLENEVVAFREAKGAVDLSEQSRNFLKNLSDNDNKLNDIDTKLAVLKKIERYVIVKDNNAGIVPATLGIHDPVLNQLLEKLYNSEIEYSKLRTITAENNPVLISLKDEIDKIRPSILENIQSQRANLLASKAHLQSINNQYQSSLNSIPEKEKDLLGISRQQAIKNNAYSFLLQKREETVLSYAPSADGSRVVDFATASLLPVSPKPLYVYIIGVALALFFGITLVSAKELVNTKILFRSEIEKHLNYPIVAELPFDKTHKSKEFIAPTDIALIEQFRQFRTTMGLYGKHISNKKIMVTSSIPGEGKSYVSSNLAYSLSQSNKRVLLIDIDTRNPITSQYFKLLKQPGISEYLSGDISLDECVSSTKFSCLDVLPAGLKTGDCSELIHSEKILILFNLLEAQYDYIIIDTPPLELVSDAFVISELCDFSLLVVRHAHTPKNLIQRLSQNNKLAQLQNTAIVFNGIKPRGFIKGQYGYGYGYGYDFKYDDKTYKNRTAINT